MRPTTPVTFALTSLAATAWCGLALVACGSDGSTASAPPVVEASVSEAGISAPTTIAPGTTTLRVTGEGSAPHQFQLLHLHDGVTIDAALDAAADPNPGALLSMVDVAGGMSLLAPGRTVEATVDLAAGDYVVVDFVGGAQPASFTVAGEAAETTTPDADVEVDLADFSVTMPGELKGDELVKVVNSGEQPHELAVMQLPAGTTMDDVMHAMHEGQEPDAMPVTGLGAIAPGATGYLNLDLPAGTYLATCFVPDPASNLAHAEMGMMTVFTVA